MGLSVENGQVANPALSDVVHGLDLVIAAFARHATSELRREANPELRMSVMLVHFTSLDAFDLEPLPPAEPVGTLSFGHGRLSGLL